MNVFMVSLRNLLLMTLLLGGIYPLSILLIGQTIFPEQSGGSLIQEKGVVIGSELLAQKFSSNKYFWPRPSSADYATMGGGASQQSATSSALKASIQERKMRFGENAPSDLLNASASGLDPHIALESANYQKMRIMAERNLKLQAMDKLILGATEDSFLGFMGQPRVNVLKLNKLLDHK